MKRTLKFQEIKNRVQNLCNDGYVSKNYLVNASFTPSSECSPSISVYIRRKDNELGFTGCLLRHVAHYLGFNYLCAINSNYIMFDFPLSKKAVKLNFTEYETYNI